MTFPATAPSSTVAGSTNRTLCDLASGSLFQPTMVLRGNRSPPLLGLPIRTALETSAENLLWQTK